MLRAQVFQITADFLGSEVEIVGRGNNPYLATMQVLCLCTAWEVDP